MVSSEVPEIPEFPVAAPGAAPGRLQPSLASASPPVLVIDDDAAGAVATQSELAGGGYAVAVEAGGDAILRLVRASLVQLVVAELYVPSAEGPRVVTVLKQGRVRLPRVRVLVHTRHTTAADLAWAPRVGADAVVPNPARAGLLLREVRRLLDGAAAP